LSQRTARIRDLLFQRYLAPTKVERPQYAGIELELPLVNLTVGSSSSATILPVDFAVVHTLTRRFAEHFSFASMSIDDEGDPYCLEDSHTGDIFTYDCSYNNLEISFGCTQNLHEIHSRFSRYYRFIQGVLAEYGHSLTGMGVNPHRSVNRHIPLPVGRYQMLYHFLSQARDLEQPAPPANQPENSAQPQSNTQLQSLHSFPEYGMFTSASQIQIDVEYDALIPTIRAFSYLEPLKAVLFANSLFSHQGVDYLCCRDMLWEQSMHGVNPRNTGMFEQIPATSDELLDYLASLSMFCTERDGCYLSFAPIPVLDYFEQARLTGTYIDPATRTVKSMDFAPQAGDLNYLRAYKLVDLTFRGTIEYRSVCCQPLCDTMTVPAFHWGLVNKIDELNALFAADKTLFNRAHTPSELRRLFTYAAYPGFVSPDDLRALLIAVLELASNGLCERGLGEEVYLTPLFERAYNLQNPAQRYRTLLSSGRDPISLIEDYAILD